MSVLIRKQHFKVKRPAWLRRSRSCLEGLGLHGIFQDRKLVVSAQTSEADPFPWSHQLHSHSRPPGSLGATVIMPRPLPPPRLVLPSPVYSISFGSRARSLQAGCSCAICSEAGQGDAQGQSLHGPLPHDSFPLSSCLSLSLIRSLHQEAPWGRVRGGHSG